MTEIHRNLIFFDENSKPGTWINEEEMNEFRYHQVRTMLTNNELISTHQMKFYYKRRCRNGHK